MRCPQVKRNLSAYVDGEVSDSDKKFISEHLKHCPECHKEMTALTNVVAAMNILQGAEVPLFFMTRLKQRLQEEAGPLPVLVKIRKFMLSAASVLAMVVSLLIGNQIGRILYYSIAETSVEQSSGTTDILGLGTFEEFPNGSLSDMYNELLAGGNNG